MVSYLKILKRNLKEKKFSFKNHDSVECIQAQFFMCGPSSFGEKTGLGEGERGANVLL